MRATLIVLKETVFFAIMEVLSQLAVLIIGTPLVDFLAILILLKLVLFTKPQSRTTILDYLVLQQEITSVEA